MKNTGSLQDKSILFLQGPMGLFFKKIESSYAKKGVKTYKIGFTMGDQIFSNRKSYIPFREKPELWEDFITEFLLQKNIDKVFLFGDCRYYQHIARTVAYRLKIDVYVFEEGYIRPDYITMEKFGVNGFSTLPRDPNFYKTHKLKQIEKPQRSKPSQICRVFSATLYYAFSNLFYFKYPYYRHHRDFSAIKEAFFGFRSLLRKGIYQFTEKHYLPFIRKEISKKYYFVPLQTHNDFQILKHSRYRSIEKFILEVLESFAHHAPDDHYLKIGRAHV